MRGAKVCVAIAVVAALAAVVFVSSARAEVGAIDLEKTPISDTKRDELLSMGWYGIQGEGEILHPPKTLPATGGPPIMAAIQTATGVLGVVALIVLGGMALFAIGYGALLGASLGLQTLGMVMALIAAIRGSEARRGGEGR